MILHLSANGRLSSYLKQAAVTQADKTVVATPWVMTWGQWWQAWQDQAWLSGELPLEAMPKRVISPFEAARQWQDLLEKHSAESALLNQTETAKQLYQAWCLWLEYGQPQWEHGSQEWQLFQACAKDYQAWLVRYQWQDEPGMMALRLEWFAQGVGTCPEQVHWHGFDELTPFMLRWQDLAQARGVAFERVQNAWRFNKPALQADLFAEPVLSRAHFVAQNPQQELQQAAAFCVQQLEQALQQNRPLAQIRIAVVAPNVAEIKSALCFELDQLLFQQFADHPLLAEHSTQRLYNLSLGEPLTHKPYGRFLMQSLRMMLGSPNLAFAEWSQWLTSAYTAGDRLARQSLDKALRRKQWANIRWPGLVEATESLAWPKPLRKLLQAMAERSQPKGLVDLDGFVDYLQQALAMLGASVSVSLNSDEYQQAEPFKQALVEFAGLRSLNHTQSYQAWWSVWQAFLAQITHQSQSTWLQPIQIMGMLEAGGQYFDAMWVLGLDDQAWPRPAQPNAFLPVAMQRQCKMPRADAMREYDYARELTGRLLQSADCLVLSYARHHGEAERLPSPLIPADIAHYAPLAVACLMQRTEQARERFEVEDVWAPPVEKGAFVPGGTGILAAQRQCPLMAFLDYRLGANYGLQAVEDGLASTDQGKVVHRVLELFWQQVETQAGLLAMSDQERTALLRDLLAQEFEAFAQRFSAPYLQSEQQRILRLLQDWLALEAQRPLGFKVLQTEQQSVLALADMQFNITLDRLDQTEQGLVVLDYKTGKARISDLLKDPIAAPQLAVYLHQLNDDVAALGYGLLHSDEGVKWSAVSEQGGVLAKERDWSRLSESWGDMSWHDYLQFLRDQVMQLAQQVGQGYAPVVYQQASDVQYAKAKLALRLPEVRAQLQTGDQEVE